jgi:hypothetical protein
MRKKSTGQNEFLRVIGIFGPVARPVNQEASCKFYRIVIIADWLEAPLQKSFAPKSKKIAGETALIQCKQTQHFFSG